MFGRRTTVALLACLVALSHRATSQIPDLVALRQAVAQAGGRVIITLKSSRAPAIRAPGTPPIAADELNGIQDRLQADFPLQLHTQLSLIGAIVATVADADITRLAADPSVYAIEPDVKNYLTAAVSTSLPGRPTRLRADLIPWGVADVGAPAAWAAGLDGTGVKVGIIDTGIDYTHPDLLVVGGYDFNTSSGAASSYTDNNSSCDGHGTHVAGIVAARQNGLQVVGVAPKASLYALKVFNPDAAGGCYAYTSSQIFALQWAVTNGINVVNISIGNSASPGYANAVATASAAGVVVVAAAGNSGAPGIAYPAAAPTAIAVAALDGGNTVAGYSSSGPEMWIAAPGSNIESTMPGGGTGFKSGTSMASPHVAGVAALLRQAHPTWSADQIRTEIRNLSIDIAAPGFDYASGWGLVQAPTTGGGAPALTIAVSPGARSTSVQQGNAAPSDNATVTLTGTNAGTTLWSATKKKAWLTLTGASGTGSGTVAWSRNAAGLVVGTYVDTITVTAAGAVGSPAIIYDTLKITAAPIPVALAVSPAARVVSAQQGTAVPSDNATVTLTGTNAGTTAWSATKKQAWLTLTGASGTGSGTVAWSRNTSGLTVGTYVDTITVTAAGATGSPTVVFDTLRITAAPIPVAIAVSPAARAVSVAQGGASPSDNATVTLTGTNASTTVWLATKRTAWLTLTTANGTGSGTVAWARNSAGLSVGIYVDTITVTASGATGSPTMIFDTLKITAVAAPLTLAVNPAARSVSVPQGTAAPSDFADVILTGTNASSTVRSASHRQPWFAFSNAGGTGSGTIRWDRNTTGLAAGTYVDTITVTASGAIGSPAVIYDTLKITAAAAVPLVIALSPAGRRVAVVQGNAAPGGNATVTLTGTGSASAPWSATKKTSWVTLATASGTGSGTVAWSRNAAGLSVGTYVDTITVSASGAAGSPTTLFDTLQVTATSSAIALAVNPAARKVSVQIGSAAAGDNATVTLTGTGSQTTSWWAVKKQPWLTLTTAAGMGNGTVTWTRNAAGLAAGTYVDTIMVSSAATGSAVVFDTLNVTAPPVPIVVAVNPASRNSAVQQGGNASGDNALVTLTGTNAASTSWSATNRHGWLILVTASGTGNGALVWNRNAGGLGVGTYVDTITVTAAGVAGLPATLYDTLRITAVATPVVLAVSPGSRSISVPQGTAGWGDNVAVTFTGTDAGSAVWSATHTNVSWAAFVNTSGTGNGFVTWNRNLASLAAGTYVDTITVAVAGSPQSLRVYDTVRVTSTIALNPRGHRARTLHFSGVSNLIVAGLDSALVEASAVDSASAAGWVATVNSGRLQLAVATGAVNSYVRWARPAVVLSPGLYVDTISVSLQADRTVRAQFVDSLEVVAVTMPTPDVAVGDLFDHRSLTDDQRDTLDREGNSNGHYDLGDFLAWVNRNHIRLSTAASLKLKQVPPGS